MRLFLGVLFVFLLSGCSEIVKEDIHYISNGAVVTTRYSEKDYFMSRIDFVDDSYILTLYGNEKPTQRRMFTKEGREI